MLVGVTEELENWHGAVTGTAIEDGRRWVVKWDGRKELLGHALAHGMLNVAEVRLARRTYGLPAPEVLVLLAYEYGKPALPIQDLDESVASELAFSMWIRRRDTHAFNRAYVDGIPLFFDHGAAFDPTESLEAFLRPGDDFGYVPSWRVEVVDEPPTTMGMRRRTQSSGLALHAISDRTRFFRHLEAWIERLSQRDRAEVEECVRSVGFRGEEGAVITKMLNRTQVELPEALAGVRTLLELPPVR
jgi:hypothetical protein